MWGQVWDFGLRTRRNGKEISSLARRCSGKRGKPPTREMERRRRKNGSTKTRTESHLAHVYLWCTNHEYDAMSQRMEALVNSAEGGRDRYLIRCCTNHACRSR